MTSESTMRLTWKQSLALAVLLGSGPLLKLSQAASKPDAGRMMGVMLVGIVLLILFMPRVKGLSWLYELNRAERNYLRGRDFSAFRRETVGSNLRKRLMKYTWKLFAIAVCALLGMELESVVGRDAQAVLFAVGFYFLGSMAGCVAMATTIARPLATD